MMAGIKRKNEAEAVAENGKPSKRASLGEISNNAPTGKSTLKKSMKKGLTNIVSKVMYILLLAYFDYFYKVFFSLDIYICNLIYIDIVQLNVYFSICF
jgi:hypothetical protein